MAGKIISGFSNIDMSKQIMVLKQSDGSIIASGISRANQTISVYHGETLLLDCTMPSTGETSFPTVVVGVATLHDESFSGFVQGEAYTIVAGEEAPVTGFYADSNILASFGVDDLWTIFAINDRVCTEDFTNSHANFSISQNVTTVKKRYDIKLLPEDLLPKTVAKKVDVQKVQKIAETAQSTAYDAQSTAYAAQSTANAAQNTANAAQSTANTAKSTANAAQRTADAAQSTANAAQRTADAAQSTANTAKSTANAAQRTADAAATKKDPVFTGSFSQNRKADSTVGTYSHAEGSGTTASGDYSHAEGNNTTASGAGSHAEGMSTSASGAYSHAEGDNVQAIGDRSHAEGSGTTASGAYSHAEGFGTKAIGDGSHAEGLLTTASGNAPHAEGSYTTASGDYSHAEGSYTTASGAYSHAEGRYTTASSNASHAEGKYNIPDTAKAYAHIVGNGSSDEKRSNAHTLDWRGNAWFAGDVYVGSTSGTNKDNGSKKLATQEYADDKALGMDITGASAGQIIKIKSVDANGKPTEWESVDAADVPTKVSELDNDSNFATTLQVNAKYTKPSAGIPKTDLAAVVQNSLDKADTALQSAPVTSVAGKTGAVSLSKTDVALGNVDNVRQYSASNPPPYPVTSVNGKTGAVTVESGTKVTQYTGTLLASGWSEDSYGYKSQTITISGLKASYGVDPEWDVSLSGTDPEADAALLEGFALIHNYKTGANSLTAQCIGSTPEVNIPIKVVVFE